MSSDARSTRRQFMLASAWALGTVPALVTHAAQPPAQPAQPTPQPPPPPPPRFFQWREVVPGVLVGLSPAGDPAIGANSVLVLGKEEALLIDAKYVACGPSLRKEAESFGRPLKRVILTHHHPDHTGGAFAFTPDIPVVGHSQCKARVLAQLPRYAESLDGSLTAIAKVAGEPTKSVLEEGQKIKARFAEMKAEQFAPTQTIDADTNLEVGGIKLQVRVFGSAHTDNDLVVHLPELNVLVVGGLVVGKLHAYLDRPGGGTVAGWLDTLTKLSGMCNDKTVIIPANGDPAGPDSLRQQAEYLTALRGYVLDAVKAGKVRDEVVKAAIPPAYESFALPAVYALTMGAIFDELTPSK